MGKPMGTGGMRIPSLVCFPARNWIPMARTKVLSPPYFHAGVVALTCPSRNWGMLAANCAQTGPTQALDVPIHRPYLDQIALPLPFAGRYQTTGFWMIASICPYLIRHPPEITRHKRISWQKDIDRINSVGSIYSALSHAQHLEGPTI